MKKSKNLKQQKSLKETYSPYNGYETSNPVSVSVNLSASGSDNIDDLISILKNAGMTTVNTSSDSAPMRTDMEKFGSIVRDLDTTPCGATVKQQESDDNTDFDEEDPEQDKKY